MGASARLALTQHFANKGRTQPSPASDPISLSISNYYTAPLGSRRILEAGLPSAHDRTDLSADPIYFYHPSAREYLHHPLLLHPAAPTVHPVIIDNYYITSIYSTNTQNNSSFYIYIYLPNDYDQTTNIIDILIIQLNSMRAARYPTSPSGTHAATVTANSEDPPAAELDDDPFDTATLYNPPQLSTCPYKFRLTIPANSPATADMLLLVSRQAHRTTQIPNEYIPTHLPDDLCTRLL
jgi:hypothetical protein